MSNLQSQSDQQAEGTHQTPNDVAKLLIPGLDQALIAPDSSESTNLKQGVNQQMGQGGSQGSKNDGSLQDDTAEDGLR